MEPDLSLRAVILALIACATAHSQVSVRRDAGLQETTYSISTEGCRIDWIIYGSEAKRGVIHHHSDCGLPPAAQIPLISRLLNKLIEDRENISRLRALFWGRLHPDGKPDPELAIRLVLAAKRSATWDAVRGVPKAGHENNCVRDLVNAAPIYPELRDAFRKAGWDLRVAYVEKVLIQPARRLPFFDRLPKGVVGFADRLPYDCAVWFSISEFRGQATQSRNSGSGVRFGKR